MMLLRGTVGSCVWCSTLFSDAACAGSVAGFDTLGTVGAECIAVLSQGVLGVRAVRVLKAQILRVLGVVR